MSGYSRVQMTTQLKANFVVRQNDRPTGRAEILKFWHVQTSNIDMVTEGALRKGRIAVHSFHVAMSNRHKKYKTTVNTTK